MTQVDSSAALRHLGTPLDSEPAGPGQVTQESREALCMLCKNNTDNPVMIGFVERANGVGPSYYACLPCATRYAKQSTAPAWLRESLKGKR